MATMHMSMSIALIIKRLLLLIFLGPLITFQTIVYGYVPPSFSLRRRYQSHAQTGWNNRYLMMTADATTEDDNDADSIQQHHISIEYCTGCRWMMRSVWMANELLTTFSPSQLNSVTLHPCRQEQGGIFTVRYNNNNNNDDSILWDRTINGGFPESKQLKQILRNVVDPTKDLGHSDVDSSITSKNEDCQDCNDGPSTAAASQVILQRFPNVSIQYPTAKEDETKPSKWLLRSSWVAQELLMTFPNELNSITMTHSNQNESFHMQLMLDEQDIISLWCEVEDGSFPDLNVVSRKIHSALAHDGHEDEDSSTTTSSNEDLDEDDAADMRRYFGVI